MTAIMTIATSLILSIQAVYTKVSMAVSTCRVIPACPSSDLRCRINKRYASLEITTRIMLLYQTLKHPYKAEVYIIDIAVARAMCLGTRCGSS